MHWQDQFPRDPCHLSLCFIVDNWTYQTNLWPCRPANKHQQKKGKMEKSLKACNLTKEKSICVFLLHIESMPRIQWNQAKMWLFLNNFSAQQQSSSSSSNRFIEHDVSTRKLGPSSGIRPSFLNRSIYTFLLLCLGRIPEEGPSFRVETSCSIKRLLEDEELCCWL